MKKYMENKTSKRPSGSCLAFCDGSLGNHVALLPPYGNWLNGLRPLSSRMRRHRPHLLMGGVQEKLQPLTHTHTYLKD